MTTAILSTAYFGPVQWYQKLHRYEEVWIEQYDTFAKQTFRNRCVIATEHGTQALTIPIEHFGPHTPTRDIRISDHGRWRSLHFNAIRSAYGESPFFEFYVDDLAPFFERKWTFLIDFNEAITNTMSQLLDIRPNMRRTTCFFEASRPAADRCFQDFREVIHPKHPIPDEEFSPRPYYQVFAAKNGFQSNLSILDLLMNEGNESIFYL